MTVSMETVVWRNPDQERTNQNARIYLKTTLPYNKLGYLSLDIICSSKLTVFLELHSRKTVRFSEQMVSVDKYPSIFSRQMKAIVYLVNKRNSLHLTLEMLTSC